jgi:hypothetical protein
MPRVCELSSYQDARALKPDRFIVQFALINREDLTGTVSHRIASLRNEKRTRKDHAANREMMSVSSLTGAGRQLLHFDFLVSVGFELRFKFVLVHRNLLSHLPFQ